MTALEDQHAYRYGSLEGRARMRADDALERATIRKAKRRALEKIDGIQEIARASRAGPRHGVTELGAQLYDKGYDDALEHARNALRNASEDPDDDD